MFYIVRIWLRLFGVAWGQVHKEKRPLRGASSFHWRARVVLGEGVVGEALLAEARTRRTFARNEGDELGNTLLHAFLCFLGDFCILGQSSFHDARDWSKVSNVSVC